MHQKHWGSQSCYLYYGANATENKTLLRTLADPGGTGYDRCLHASIVARLDESPVFLTPYKTECFALFRHVCLVRKKHSVETGAAVGTPPSTDRFPGVIAFQASSWASCYKREKKLTTIVRRRTEREMTAGAGSDTFAWGLGGDHRDESPTKRRRTATQWYGEDQQQPTDSIPLAGLTRRNRTKTWPSSDASTQQQPTKDSLQLSLSTVAALAKDLNLMEALVLSPHEMEAQRHMVKVPHSQRSMRPLTHPLAQGCPLGPQENPSLLCAKERLHQRSNRVVPAESRRFQCFLTTLRRSRMTFAAHQRRRERRKRPATTMAVPLLRHWQLPQQAGRRRGGLPPTAHSLPPRAAAPPTRCWRLSRTALTAQHRARGRRLRRTSPPVRHRYLRCTCSRPT